MSGSLAACLLGTLLPILDPRSAASDDDAAKPQLVTLDLADLGDEDPTPRAPFGPRQRNFLADLERLKQLAADPSVVAIRLEPVHGLDGARATDVLRELHAAKAAGKKLVCFAEALDRSALQFASMADLLMIPPAGEIALEAPSAELLYMKELLAKVGVRYDVLHVGEFKTAFEDMSRATMSDEQRLSMRALLKERYETTVETIAKNRRIDRAKVEAGFEAVLVSPAEALALGLIDAVGYEDEFDAKVAALLGAAPDAIEMVEEYGEEEGPDLGELDNPFALFGKLKELLEPKEESLPDGARIAIVYASGGITSGESSVGFGGATMGADTIVAALDTARDDEQVKAVVLRINSPGGSALASDLIWRAVQRCREKKPVIASMGGVAASGGYWIAMGCDRILAQPSTITGSIGVVAAVPNLAETWEKVGINVEVVGYGPHAEELSMMRDGLPQVLRGKLERSMQEIYAEFVAKAAKGRKLDPVALELNARGRVWSGREAKEIGLIDGFGGLREAIAMACFLGGRLDPATTPRRELPEAPDFFEQLKEQFGGLVSAKAPLALLAREFGGEAVADALAPFLAEPAAGQSRWQLHCTLPWALRIR